jgi:GNAT superfamily N-acetyltransferase
MMCLVELRKATPAQADVILDLAEEARLWLRGKDTDQWAVPWGGTDGPRRRIMSDIAAGLLWIVWDGETGAATITVDAAPPVDGAGNSIWPPSSLDEPALYVHRVIVRRSHAGKGLGAALFDWASSAAVHVVGSALIRIDVWTDNLALHKYYLSQGFESCGFRSAEELPDYPCRALFQRRHSDCGFLPFNEQ